MKLSSFLSLLLLGLSACAAPPKPAARPEIISREEWGSQPQPLPDSRKHVPQFITIHHAGVTWKAGGDPV